MHQFIALYLVSVPIFFLIDMLWLGVVASSFYRAQIGHLMGDINWAAAVIFYLIYLVGLTYFATAPAVAQGSIAAALTAGALFGFFTYATYDLTNLSTLRDWPLTITLVDIAWGTVLGASVAALSYLAYTTFFG
jgi:uncharacterized membrane protein